MLYGLFGVLILVLILIANIKSEQRVLPKKKYLITVDKFVIMAICALLFLILSLQSVSSNGDLFSYYSRYTMMQHTETKSFLHTVWKQKDPIYYIVGFFFSKLGFDFYAWKSLIAFVFVLGLYKQIFFYSTNPAISFIAVLTLGLYGFTFSGLRQSLAIGILLFTYPYLKNKRFIRFVLLVGVAAMFHSTAMIFLLAYPAYQLKVRLRSMLFLTVAGIVVCIFASPLANIYLQMMGTDEIYAEYLEQTNVLNFSGIIISGCIWIFCTTFLYRNGSNKIDAHLCHLSLLALFGRILSAFWFAEFFRIAMYFCMFEFLTIADACSCKEKGTFAVRVKTAFVTLALGAYYLNSPNASYLIYYFR